MAERRKTNAAWSRRRPTRLLLRPRRERQRRVRASLRVENAERTRDQGVGRRQAQHEVRVWIERQAYRTECNPRLLTGETPEHEVRLCLVTRTCAQPQALRASPSDRNLVRVARERQGLARQHSRVAFAGRLSSGEIRADDQVRRAVGVEVSSSRDEIAKVVPGAVAPDRVEHFAGLAREETDVTRDRLARVDSRRGPPPRHQRARRRRHPRPHRPTCRTRRRLAASLRTCRGSCRCAPTRPAPCR